MENTKRNGKRFRVGIVGAGQISAFHLKALSGIPDVDIVGIVDRDRARAEALKDRFGIPAIFSDLKSLAKEQVDVIHVLTPPASHAALVCEGLELGCHVFVEKPMATQVADGKKIIELAHKKNRTVCAGHSLLYDPFVRKGLDLIRNGAIGEPLTVEYFRAQRPPPYVGGPLPETFRDGGGAFRDLGIHALYLIEAILGPIQDSSPYFSNTRKVPNLHFDELRVLLQCEKGTGHIQMSWNVRPQQNLIVVQGTHGILRIDLFGMAVTAKRAMRLPEHATRVVNTLRDGISMDFQVLANAARIATKRLKQFHGVQTLVAEYYRSLREGTASPVTPEAALSAISWMEKIASHADAQKTRDLRPFVKPLRAKVLVTGANGFIGRHLVSRLLEENVRVRLLVRTPPPPSLLKHPKVEVVLGDLGDPQVVDRACAGIDTLYHLGAALRGSMEDFDRGTILGTQLIVDAAAKHKVKRMIYMSSLSVLHSAQSETSHPVDENWDLEPLPASRGNYSRTKTAAEHIVLEARKKGLAVVILRPGEVVGQGAPLVTSGVAQKIPKGFLILGNGNLKVPSIYIEDLIDATCAAAGNPKAVGKIYHLVDPGSLTQNEILESYLDSQSSSKSVFRLPLLGAFALALAVQLLCKILGRPAPLSLYRLKSATTPHTFNCSRAAKELGWSPRIGVARGLRICLGLEAARSSEVPLKISA